MRMKILCILVTAVVVSSCSTGDSNKGIILSTNTIKQSQNENSEDLAESALDEVEDTQHTVPSLEYKFNDILLKVKFELSHNSVNPKAKMHIIKGDQWYIWEDEVPIEWLLAEGNVDNIPEFNLPHTNVINGHDTNDYLLFRYYFTGNAHEYDSRCFLFKEEGDMLSLVSNLNNLSVTSTIEQVDCVIVDITAHGGRDSKAISQSSHVLTEEEKKLPLSEQINAVSNVFYELFGEDTEKNSYYYYMHYRLQSPFFGINEVIYPADIRSKWIEGARFANHKWYDLTDIDGDGFEEIIYKNKFVSSHDLCRLFSLLSIDAQGKLTAIFSKVLNMEEAFIYDLLFPTNALSMEELNSAMAQSGYESDSLQAAFVGLVENNTIIKDQNGRYRANIHMVTPQKVF